jgi:uncharacterized membrane protein YhaH (DUF805 family)
MVAEEAYYLDGSRNQQGPVPIAEIGRLIRGGTIRRDTLVWYPGMPDWRPASQVTELASFFGGAAPPPRPPAGPPPAQAMPTASAPMQRRAPMGGAYPGRGPQAQATQSDSGGSMGFGGAIATCFRKYVDFTGRARRKEYWFFHLFYLLTLVVLVAIDGAILASGGGAAVFTMLGMLALALPTLAVVVRRLHDTDHSGWMYFIMFVPLVGIIIFLVFMCQRGTAGPNRFGPDPLGLDVAGTFE